MRHEYTDNLFLSSTTKNREAIVTYGPTLNLEQRGTLSQFKLDYAYEKYEFLNEAELNARDERHFGDLDGELFPERNLKVEFNAAASMETLDRRRSDATDLPTVNTTNRYHGQVRPVYRFKFGARYSGEAAYVFEVNEYENSVGDETESRKVELAIEKEKSARLKLRLSGFFEQFEASQSKDYDHIQATFGGEWGSGDAFQFNVSGGMAWFDYEDGTDAELSVIDGKVHCSIGRRHAIDVGYIEAVDHDVTDGQHETRQGEAALSRSGRLGWRIGYVYRDDHFVEVDRDDLDQGVQAEVSYQLTRKVLLQLEGDSRQLEFDPLGEVVDRDNVAASVEYAPHETIQFQCLYAYRNNDSSIDANDYEENRTYCEARFSYPLIRR